MYEKTEGHMRCMVADPDAARRGRIVASGRPGMMTEAASLSEAFDRAEAQRPDAVALSTDITGEPGLDMFLHLVDALSIAFVVYGDRSRDRTPQRLRKSIAFVPLGPGDDTARVLDALLSERAGPARGAAQGPAIDPSHAPSLITLGASTGGVSALEVVLSTFPATCPPTLVVQHIRAGFVDGMIKRMDRVCLPRIVPAENAVRVQPGHVYVAHDPERHLVVEPGETPRCRLLNAPPRHGHRPSVDALFESVAGRRGVAAALLTGMGADGAEGLDRIKRGGGLTIAQDEATCVVYGMPKVAADLGAAVHVLPLDRIAPALIDGALPRRPTSSAPHELAR